MKIVMLGPVYPYKSGIAQYTGAMCAALGKEHEVKALSFSLLLMHTPIFSQPRETVLSFPKTNLFRLHFRQLQQRLAWTVQQ